MHPLEHAKRYAAAGWYVFPCAPGSKVPLLRGDWKELATIDVNVIDGWLAQHPKANYGIYCGKSNLVVVDVDNKGGKDGDKAWEDLQHEASGECPETRRVDTPSGGHHYYFHGSTASRTGIRTGVDICSEGHYVVGPGSWIDGKSYVDAQNAPPAPLPEWIFSEVGKTVEAPPGEQLAPAFTLPADMMAAVAWLRNEAPLAIEGDAGNNTTYTTACRLKDLRLTEEDAYQAMLTEWNDSCSPPWSEEELRTIVGNAYRYGKNPPGVMAVSVFATQEVPEEDRLIHISKFIRTKPPEREWIVENWIPKKAPSLLTGEGGVGKSSALIQLAICGALALPWFGLNIPRPVSTLLVSCEDAEDELHRRLHAMGMAPEFAMLNLEHAGCWCFPRVGRDSILMQLARDGRTPMEGAFMAKLRARLDNDMPKGHKLVILDTVPDCFAGNENDRQHVNFFSKQILGSLTLRNDCTIVCNAHPSKAEGSEYSGSTAWNGAFRSRMQMSFSEDGEDFRTLELRKSNYARAGQRIVLKRGDDGVLRVTSLDDALAEACGMVLRACRQAEEIGSYLSLQPCPGHALSKAVINNRAGRPISEVAKVDAARALIEKGLLAERPIEGRKVRALHAVTLEEMMQ